MDIEIHKKEFKFIYIDEEDDHIIFFDDDNHHFIGVKDERPECLVVYPTSTIQWPGTWPGRLFEVEIVNKEEETDLNENISDSAYRRSKLVKIVQELNVDLLFGGKGKVIREILNFTLNLDQKTVNILSEKLTEKAKDLYSKAWENWYHITNYGEGLPKNHLGVIYGYNGCPVNSGLVLLSSLIDKQAEKFLGEKAFTYNLNHEGIIDPMWGKAKQVLLNAAISGGAPKLLSDSENQYMLEAWYEIKNAENEN